MQGKPIRGPFLFVTSRVKADVFYPRHDQTGSATALPAISQCNPQHPSLGDDVGINVSGADAASRERPIRAKIDGGRAVLVQVGDLVADPATKAHVVEHRQRGQQLKRSATITLPLSDWSTIIDQLISDTLADAPENLQHPRMQLACQLHRRLADEVQA